MEKRPGTPQAAQLVERLGLLPHPEGGWFREVHRSVQGVQTPEHGRRSAFTSILFLLEAPDVSRFHRIDAEELWSWHAGTTVLVRVLGEDGREDVLRLGAGADDAFQVVVPAGLWFGAEIAGPEGWALVGCVVAPGFEFSRFRLADRGELLASHPLQAETVRRMTREVSG